MKRTDIERRERELKRMEKRARNGSDETGRSGTSSEDYVDELFERFIFDETKIYNSTEDIQILEILERVKKDFPDKWEDITRRAVRKTKIKKKKQPCNELIELVG